MVGSATRDDSTGAARRLAIIGGVALAVALVVLSNVVGSAPLGERGDFGAFLSSGKAAAAGADPYVAPFPAGRGPNLNPPVTVLAFQAVAALDPHVLAWVWWIISLGCMAVAVLVLREAYPEHVTLRHVAVLLGNAGLWAGLAEGQIYAPLALGATGAWLLLRRHPVIAGVLIGLVVAVKPNFLLWPVLLLFSGAWVPAVAAGAAAASLSALPLFVYGPAIYRSWLHVISGGAPSVAVNASLSGLVARFGLPQFSHIVAAGLLAALAFWAWRRRPDLFLLSGVALVASLFASPVAWVTYFVFLLPVFCTRRWTGLVWASALLQLTPYWLLWSPPVLTGPGLILGGMASSGVLLLLLGDILGGRLHFKWWKTQPISAVRRQDSLPSRTPSDYSPARRS